MSAEPALPPVVNLGDALGRVTETWSPRIVADVNDAQVKLARLRGEFVWHRHAGEDELFLILEGRLRLRFREGDRDLGPGELIVVPRGVEHCPVTLTEEVCVLLVEPRTTINTGDVQDARTVLSPERL